MIARSVPGRFLAIAAGLVLGVLPVPAQQHTATRLGNPATRFADPLHTVADLRDRLLSEKLRADVAAILAQCHYKGDVEDFRRAVAAGPIFEWSIPVGTRLKAMSSRKDGKPILLQDVLWAGKEPVAAYLFQFASKGTRYRCITPKPCSNFWVEDLGPDTPADPKLELAHTAPASASLCATFPLQFTVRNSGTVPLSNVTLTEELPQTLRTADGQTSLRFDAGRLAPNESRDFAVQILATTPGPLTTRATASAAEGITATAESRTTILAPRLLASCSAPDTLVPGRPFTLCVSATNVGDAPEGSIHVSLPVPPGLQFEGADAGGRLDDGVVRWELPSFAPAQKAAFCARFVKASPGSFDWTARVQGECAAPAECKGGSHAKGIPAILLEVVDLEDPIEVGKPEVYEIKVTNQGSAVGTGIRLTCLLEEFQEFVSATGSTEVEPSGRTLRTRPLAELAPKGEATWRIIVKALKAADVRFTVDLESDQIDRPVHETEATQQY